MGPCHVGGHAATKVAHGRVDYGPATTGTCGTVSTGRRRAPTRRPRALRDASKGARETCDYGDIDGGATDQNGRRSNTNEGGRRRSTASHGDDDELGGEEEKDDVQEGDQLTLSTNEWSARRGRGRGRRNLAKTTTASGGRRRKESHD